MPRWEVNKPACLAGTGEKYEGEVYSHVGSPIMSENKDQNYFSPHRMEVEIYWDVLSVVSYEK